MGDLTKLSKEDLKALSKEDLDKLDKEKELIPSLRNINAADQRDIVIKRTKYFEGSNYDLFKDSLSVMGKRKFKNVPEENIKSLYCTWLQHGKLSRNYTYEDFRCIISFDKFYISNMHSKICVLLSYFIR